MNEYLVVCTILYSFWGDGGGAGRRGRCRRQKLGRGREEGGKKGWEGRERTMVDLMRRTEQSIYKWTSESYTDRQILVDGPDEWRTRTSFSDNQYGTTKIRRHLLVIVFSTLVFVTRFRLLYVWHCFQPGTCILRQEKWRQSLMIRHDSSLWWITALGTDMGGNLTQRKG